MIEQRERFERAFELFVMPEPAFDRLARRRHRKQRNQRLAAGIVAVALFAGASIGLAFALLREGSPMPAGPAPAPDATSAPAETGPAPSPAPATGGVGSVGLPPEGAVPSSPVTGELIATLDARPGTGFPEHFVPVHQVWVYADGRVIWRREPLNATEEAIANDVNGPTGFLERRLTPAGVELLRSELLSTGLFDGDGYFLSDQGLSWGEIEVRNGDHLVSVSWCCPALNPPQEPADYATAATPRQTGDLIRLSEGLADLASWLPASAWVDREATAYVSSKYAVCYRQWYTDRELEPSDVLGALPPAAQNLLRGKDMAYDVFSSPLADPPTADPAVCSEVTTEEARALYEVLSDADFAKISLFLSVPSYRAEAPDPIGRFTISFEPILPHGQWEGMGG